MSDSVFGFDHSLSKTQTSTDPAVDKAGDMDITGLTKGSLEATNAGSADGWVTTLNASSGNLLDSNNNVSSQPTDQSVFSKTQQLSNTNPVQNNQTTDVISLGLSLLTSLAPPSNGSRSDTIYGIELNIYNTLVGAVINQLLIL